MIQKIRRGIQNPNEVAHHLRLNVFDPIDQSVSKAVYNRPIGFSNIVAGRLAMRRAKRNSTVDLSAAPNHEIQKLRNQEFVHLGQPFDKELIERIRSKYTDRIEDDDYSEILGEHEGEVYLRSLGSWDDRFNLFEEIPGIVELLDDHIRAVLEGYYGSHFQPIRVQGYRTYHIPPRVVEETEIYSNYWHCDAHTPDHMKLFVYLGDVGEDDGPLHVVTKEDTDHLLESGFRRGSDGIPDGVVEDNADVIRFTGPTGSAAIANTQTILHRAGNPSPDKPRDMLMFQFAPSTEPITEDWTDQCSRDVVDGFKRLFSY